MRTKKQIETYKFQYCFKKLSSKRVCVCVCVCVVAPFWGIVVLWFPYKELVCASVVYLKAHFISFFLHVGPHKKKIQDISKLHAISLLREKVNKSSNRLPLWIRNKMIPRENNPVDLKTKRWRFWSITCLLQGLQISGEQSWG